MSLVALANVLHDDIFVTRFHADPRVKATELLLQERVPREAILAEARPAEGTKALPAGGRDRVATVSNAAHHESAYTFPVQWALHRRLDARRRWIEHVARAVGHSQARGPHVGRRSAFHLPYGSVVGRTVWSPTYQPVCREPDEFETMFELEKVTFRRRDGDFDTQLQVVVSPEDDVEVRRLSITNRGDRPREIEVTSYAEIVLARPEDDLAHPAFGKLFIETEYDAQSAGTSVQPAAAIGRREPRLGVSRARRRWPARRRVEWETDRARFLGRGRSPGESDRARRAGVVGDNRRGSGSGRGAARARAAGARRVRARHLRHRCRARSSDGAGAGAKIPRRQRGGARVLDGVDARAHHAAASGTDRRSGDAVRSAGVTRLRIRRIWHEPRRHRAEHLRAVQPVGVRASPATCRSCSSTSATPSAISLVRQLLHAQEYWRVKDLRADVVILNDHPADYLDEVQAQLTSLRARAAVERLARQTGRDVPGAVRRHAGCRPAPAVRRRAHRVARGLRRSRAAARSQGALAVARRRSFRHRACCDRRRRPRQRRESRTARHGERHRRLHARRSRIRDRVSTATARRRCPGRTCWPIPEFGTVLSASGAAYTWAANSRENRLTPFANDPISDPTGEAIFLRDEDEGTVWGATPGPLPRSSGFGSLGGSPCRRRDAFPVRHRRARTVARDLGRAGRSGQGLAVDADEYRRSTTRRLSAFGYVEWVLGPPRSGERRFVVAEHDAATGAILARNAYNTEFKERVAFMRATEPPRSFTCDRARFHRPQSHAGGASGVVPRESRRTARSPGSIHAPRCRSPSRSRRASRARVAFVLGQGTHRARRARARAAILATLRSATMPSRARRDSGTTRSARSRSTRPTIRSICWSTGGCCIRHSVAASGRAAARTSPAARSGSAISCRMCCRCSIRDRICAAPISCWRRRVSSSKATCSTGGIRRPAAARARDVRTICCGCRTPPPPMSREPAIDSLLDEVVPFLEAPPLADDQSEAYNLPSVSRETGVGLRAFDSRD